MFRKQRYILIAWLTVCLVSLNSCGGKSDANGLTVAEDTVAKRMLQGVWIDEDDEAIFFMVKKDTIYYPDSTSLPVAFVIVDDTLVMHGATDVKYPIVKQTEHSFSFKNQVGDVFNLQKTKEDSYKKVFENQRPVAINQNQLIKRDTVIQYQDQRYHCYVQVNPTTYKVYRSSLNDDGVEVFNVYFDNIIHLSVFVDGKKLFSRNFEKNDFQCMIPESVHDQSILSDVVFSGVDDYGIHCYAIIGIPESPSSYIVEIILTQDSNFHLQVK